MLMVLEEFAYTKLYSRFDEYFAAEADDEFNRLSVCNIIYLGTFNK